ncbi:F-box/LRR-repeat protein 25-like isoform X2 [Rhododendron vialii]|uniref:F-box/LRR-repeat protein 25-like isoform X2 n=1 Tax=Rhododendron vialii TaxID=182163 RepID=UPI00265F51B0|nr:F-box/LRR-repeat protein 25-like isoform X2 [Rhododendron vialii]
MGRASKAAKTIRKNDQLIELPDGVLSTIISMLTLKDAVRTSVLSKQWRFIWICHSDLWFDSANVLGRLVSSNSISESEKKLQTCKFLERVNQFMHQRCKGTKVDSFALHFCLGKDSAPHIDQWISSAITKGVENIDLDLSESCIFMADHYSSTASEGSEEYEFPIRLLAAAGEKSRVKHLQLTSCGLIAPLDSNSLTSLVTIQLEHVKIGDEQLESLLSACLFLEGLSLHLCNCLFELNFIAPNLRLKRLSIHDCFRLQKMELRAKNLALFEYTGHLILFYFKDVPRLAEAFLNFTTDSRLDGAAYALTKFVSDVPQLETLNLVSVLAMKVVKLPETVPTTFTNIRELVLTIFPFDDEDKLCWSNYILKNFPVLYKLQLNMSGRKIDKGGLAGAFLFLTRGSSNKLSMLNVALYVLVKYR